MTVESAVITNDEGGGFGKEMNVGATLGAPAKAIGMPVSAEMPFRVSVAPFPIGGSTNTPAAVAMAGQLVALIVFAPLMRFRLWTVQGLSGL